MSGTALTIVIIVAALIVIAAIVLAVVQSRRRRALKDRFGPEYDRTVSDADSRRDAEKELSERAAQRDELDIRDLSPREAAGYREEWYGIQARFVDAPGEAVTAAQTLVTTVMRTRGYPTESTDQRESMLSVDHADVVEHFREAKDIEARGRATGVTTEDLRQAMQHWGALFDELVGPAPSVVDVTEPQDPYGATTAPTTTPGTTTRGSVSARRGSPADPGA